MKHFVSRIFFVAMLVGFVPSSARAIETSQIRVEAANSSLQVCVDKQTQKPLAGDIELMLVMDNSLSLKNNDPDGKRFEQVRQLLKSVHDRISLSKNPRQVRFSLITFAERARIEIAVSNAITLTTNNLGEVADKVEKVAPGDQSNTDYVKALEAAISEMKSASAANCRVVVWFTDGAYWPAGGASDTSSGGTLREKVCQSGGFSDQLREQNINIFPLYIEPKQPDTKEDITASMDVMVHLTGDEGAFDKDPYSPGSPCGSVPYQVGEVLNASDVNQLGQLFADLINIIEGGVAIACPTKDGRIESKLLPAGRYVVEISIVKYAAEGKELTPADLSAVQPNGEQQQLDRYFIAKDGRYEATKNALELQAGWQIQGSGEEHCIRAFPRKGLAVQIRKEGGEIKIIPIGEFKDWLEGEDLESPANDTTSPVVRLGNDVGCNPVNGLPTDAAGLNQVFKTLSEQGRGVLCVDKPDNAVFPNGVNLSVTREGQPLISCEKIVIRRTGADAFITSDRTERSTTCELDFRDSGTKFERAENFEKVLSSSEAENCNIDFVKSRIDQRSGDDVITISLVVVLSENRRTQCNVNNSVTYQYRDTSNKVQVSKIPFEINLDLQPEPDRVKALLATLIVVLMLLLAALAVLRSMTKKAAALAKASSLCAVRFQARASRTEEGRVNLSVENKNLSDIKINMERVGRADISGNDLSLMLRDQNEQILVRRELPPLRLMLREPWAWVDDQRNYVLHPESRRAPYDKNLTAPFRDAVIALDDGPIPNSKNERSITLWVIQQRGALEGDQIAIEESLKENATALVVKLFDQSPANTSLEIAGSTLSNGPSIELPGDLGGDGPSNRFDLPPPPKWE